LNRGEIESSTRATKPARRVRSAFCAEDQTAAFMAVGKSADLSTDLGLLKLGALRFPEQRLVIRLFKERLNVLEV